MIPGLPNTLSAIADFLECQQRFAGVEGFLADLEGYTLMQLAAGGPGLGAIVEIGRFLGRSTAFLAAGSKGAGRGKSRCRRSFSGLAGISAGAAQLQPNPGPGRFDSWTLPGESAAFGPGGPCEPDRGFVR